MTIYARLGHPPGASATWTRRAAGRLARPAAVLLLAGAAAACTGRDAAPDNRQAATTRAAPGLRDRLRAASSADRNAALRRAISALGHSCDGVDRARLQQRLAGVDVWAVHCTPDANWAVLVGPKGYAQAGRCDSRLTAMLKACAAPSGREGPTRG